MKHPVPRNLGFAGEAGEQGMMGRGLGESLAKAVAAGSYRGDARNRGTNTPSQ
jgi:hypothetical protein